MMEVRRPRKIPFHISGTGNQKIGFDFFPLDSRSGEILYWAIQNRLASNATVGSFYLLDQGLKPADGTAVAALDALKTLAIASAVTLNSPAPDDLVTHLDSPIDAPPTFQQSLYIYGDITSVGAWSIRGYVTVFR